MSFFEDFFKILNADGVRYVVVGGVAVVLHGHPRMTADIDLVIDLNPSEAELAIRSLTGMGLRPRVPVEPEEFADPDRRERWINERGMLEHALRLALVSGVLSRTETASRRYRRELKS